MGAVLRRMGYRKSGSVQGRLRDVAAEMGLDTSHFRGQAWGSTPVSLVEMPFTRQPDPKHLRKAATARATAWFMERGYLVCVPTEPAPYDIVVESDAGFVRVQVKSTSKRDPRGCCVVDVNRQAYDANAVRSANGSRTRCPYTEDEIDVFFIVTASGDQYLIPLSVTGGLSSLALDVKYAEFKV